MSNHFRAVGFPFDSQRNLEAFCRGTGKFAKEWIPLEHGFYVVLGPDNGVQWFGQFDRDRQPIGGDPHYVGTARLRLRVDSIHASPLEATIVGTLCDAEGEPNGPPVPIEIPDYALFKDSLTVSKDLTTLQVAAFAENVEFFADDAAFRANDTYQKMSTELFIPIGTFTPDGKAVDPPQPRVLMAGRVLSVQQRTNSFSGLSFWAAQINCQGATYDVVLEPNALQSPPTVGGILAGVFYLSGQLMPDERLRQQPFPAQELIENSNSAGSRVNLQDIGTTTNDYKQWALFCLLLAIGGLACFPLSLLAFGWSVYALAKPGNMPAARKWMFIGAAVLGGVTLAFMAAFVYMLFQPIEK